MDLELTLARPDTQQIQVAVTCNDQPSHTFDLSALIPDKTNGLPHPIGDPVVYGTRLYEALFPAQSLAHRVLATQPERILLVPVGDALDAIAWEYLHGPDGFLVCDCQFARGLPVEQRMDAPLLDQNLHIVAIPSQPLDHDVPALDIDGEWLRLKESVQSVAAAMALERVRPPTLEQARLLLANQRNRVLHFMGHGGQDAQGALLCFEQENGALDAVTARQLVQRVRGTVFLVTLNACISATPGATPFSNLAAALARQRVPYALGMRFSIPDDDARTFARAFYSELARGVSVEEALFQARLTLANSPRPWVVGVPVLYTSLASPASGFRSIAGTPIVNEYQPKIAASILPRAEGAFQGRVDELKQIGTLLTGDSRPRVITIHGGGGQGKTALAREAVERFAFAWPGGVWATSFENMSGRDVVVADLARFLGIEARETLDPTQVEQRVQALLRERRLLIVLDNAETLVEAVEAHDEAAILLAEWLRQAPGPSVSLLVTSRILLGWPGEFSCELGGLSPAEGALLFRQSAPQRSEEVDMPLAQQLSGKVDGHPLSLRLLGGTFNASAITLPAFLTLYEDQLIKAENAYVGLDHRQHTLYACIDTSVRYLNAGLRSLLSGLWIFRAPFLPESAVAIFDPGAEDSEKNPSAVRDRLYTLWQRGLLTREAFAIPGGHRQFYRLLPTTRPYVKAHLEQTYDAEELHTRLGEVYAKLIETLAEELDRNPAAITIARTVHEDCEQALLYSAEPLRGDFLLSWGWLLQRLGDLSRAAELIEQAIEAVQGQNSALERRALIDRGILYRVTGQLPQAQAMYERALALIRASETREGEGVVLGNMAVIYNEMGQPQQALTFYEQALPLTRETGDKAKTLARMADVYKAIGQPQRALSLYDLALPMLRALGDKKGEATALNNLGQVYAVMGQPQQEIACYEQALPLIREVGDRIVEADILSNIALYLLNSGQLTQALAHGEQALSLQRKAGNRKGEAQVLNNLGLMYQRAQQPQQAIAYYMQALPITRAIGDRAGESSVLNNLGESYRLTGQTRQALPCYEQALTLARATGNRLVEGRILNNIGLIYDAEGQAKEAFTTFEQALVVMREIHDRAGEATVLTNTATELYGYLNQPREAIRRLERAIDLLQAMGVSQDLAGRTVKTISDYLALIRQRTADSTGDN